MPTTTSTVVTTETKTGSNYTQTSSDSTTATVQDNDLTGAYTNTTTTSDTFSMTETGYATITYSLTETDSSDSTVTDTGNDLSGSDTTTTVASSSSTIQETGHDASSNAFTLTKTTTDSNSQTVTANDLTGDYTSTASDTTTTTNQETNSNTAGTATFTETITDISSTQENGNALTGDFTSSVTGTTTSTDSDVGSDANGGFSVTEGSSQTYSTSQSGNLITGDYTLSTSASQSYSMTETATTWTLAETGSLSSSTTENGNSVIGTYTSTTTTTDAYSMTENGTNSGNAFTETVTGTDTATTTESGTSDSQTLNRTIIVTGSYTLTDTGPGASLSLPATGTISSTIVEIADARSGIFSDSITGTDRYSLLEHFNNVANTVSGFSPGNMEFQPVGAPFQDGNPRSRNQIQPNQQNVQYEVGTPQWLYHSRETSNSGMTAGAAPRLLGVPGETTGETIVSILGGRSEQQRLNYVRNNAPVMDNVFGVLGPELALGMEQFAVGMRDGLASIAVGGLVGLATCSASLWQTALIGGAARSGMDALFQSIEISAGTQQGWNWGRTTSTFFEGALAALANRACFSGDTELMARGKWGVGWRRIDAITVDDEVLSRPEVDSSAAVAWKQVEELFKRNGFMIHLHIGGQVIRTTKEHPFYVLSKGWVAASELQAGDLLSSHDGRWTPVEEAYDTGDYETVYNVCVADWHTYFVGGENWKFSVWAHNATRYNGSNQKQLDKQVRLAVQAQLQQGNRPAAMVGAYDVKSGQFVIAAAGGDAGNLPTALVNRANLAGGIGNTIGNTTVGQCAEVQAAATLMRRGSNLRNIRFTTAYGVRTRGGVPQVIEISACDACQAMFRGLFG